MRQIGFPFLIVLLICLFVPATASAKDDWIQVRSKNFYLIGNAPEKDIKKVGTKLEQFRESFRLLFASAIVDSRVPTNVVVFKSDTAYTPFKPRRADGRIDDESTVLQECEGALCFGVTVLTGAPIQDGQFDILVPYGTYTVEIHLSDDQRYMADGN